MHKLATYLLGSLATALGLALIFTLNIFLIPILGYWMITIDLIYLFAGLSLISYIGDLSIPVLKTLLKREYYRVKFKIDKKGTGKSPSLYLKLLASLIMLFKSAEAGFEVIKDEAHVLYEKALLFVEKEKGGVNTKASRGQLFDVHKTKQRRAATISAGTLILLVIGSVIVGLLSSLIFPAIYQSRAATYTWTQNDWSGGTSTAVAVHPGDQAGWLNYASKDDNIMIDGSGNITMTSGSQDMTDDVDADFDQGSFGSWITIGGSVTLEGGMIYDGPSAGCTNFGVRATDLSTTYGWYASRDACRALCTDCDWASEVELGCVCDHQDQFGDNFSGTYWTSKASSLSAAGGIKYAYYIDFSTCAMSANNIPIASLHNARCIRRP